jgi:glutamate dehydrogenase
MSGRSTAQLVRELESRIGNWRPRRKDTDRKLFSYVARAFLHRSSEDFLLEDDGARWLGEAEKMLALAMRRPSGRSLVRVEAPSERGGIRASIVRTCMRDHAFIVDSIQLALRQQGVEVTDRVNMVVAVQRDDSGRLVQMGGSSDSSTSESLLWLEVSPVESAEDRRAIERLLKERLYEARLVVGDFRRMLRRMKDVANQFEFMASVQPERREEFEEARALIEWLSEDHFVFLGMREIEPGGRPAGEALGIAKSGDDLMADASPETCRFVDKADPGLLLHIDKSSRDSRVHRRGKIDEIAIRIFNDGGTPRGTMVVLGLFTYRALQTRGAIVPSLRVKLQEIVRLEDLTPGSFNFKSFVNAFNSLPVEYLFGADIADLRELIKAVLAAERSRRLEAHVSIGASKRSAFVFVVMPRRNYSDALREKIRDYLHQEFGANYGDDRVLVSSHGVIIAHFYLTSEKRIKPPSEEELENSIVALSATWEDRLRELLLDAGGRQEGLATYRRYHAAFSPRYQVSTSAEQALRDIAALEAVRKTGELGVAIFRDEEDVEQGTAKLRLYTGQKWLLSDIMPVLDNFGLKVVNSFSNHARFSDGTVNVLETFRFRLDEPLLVEDPRREANFLQALLDVFEGRQANDPLNRVLIPADLDGSQIALLRSYRGYARQLGHMITAGSAWPVLVKHASITRNIVQLFEARFGPDQRGRIPSRPTPARRKACEALREEALHAIDRVDSFAEDRLLRTFLELVDATLRTSAYVRDRAHPSVAHKIDCSRVGSMSDPRPWREIWVAHANLEGVHLRGGRIARGGLRWSDRPDDFRTEILGLMTTQMVKNVIIVPLGAKGGFVVRKLPSDPAERRAAGDAHYEIFIQALLDVTDNRAGGKVIPPRDVVCWDDPDPYLVVAADKGTAHLSDTANRISQERGFWLGDAFASGGSNGYDHKALGITARGAWVCIRHLLREIGINADKDEFTAIGIGDMGGDVFGNGMIEHKTTKLLAAFNHLHIFLDPDPDPAVSWRERKRLFKSKASGWDSYDPKKISKGGGVFDRHAKSIELSAPVRKMLLTEESRLSGNQLVHEILKMEADLWYNGGIGTYVKASHETHPAAADPSNDSVRIDAPELGARTVGEGGNLGFTQAARIEFARRGGKINTDFIDNAGGVNTSDHEVNLKILFAGKVDSGSMKPAARNKLLSAASDEVVHDVLVANSDQALMISLDERRSRRDLAAFERVIDDVSRHFGIKRSSLHLPAVRAVEQRISDREGLSRPELATLSARVKMKLYDELLEDPAVEMEGLMPAARNYFPESLRGRFSKDIEAHDLRREIALTRLTNRIVDHAGCTFFTEMAGDCGANPRQTFKAYSLLSRAGDLWHFKESIWDLGWKVDVEIVYEALLRVEAALRLGTRHLLENWSEERITETLRDASRYAGQLGELADSVDSILDEKSRERVESTAARFVDAGMPRSTAVRLGRLRHFPRALAVLDLAERARRPALDVAREFFAVGRGSGLFGLIRWIDEQQPDAYYDALAYRRSPKTSSGRPR